MKNTTVFPVALFLLFCSSCLNNNQNSQKFVPSYSLANPDKSYHKINFDSLMAAYSKVELDWYGGLLADKRFVGVWEHGYLYKDDAITFLSKGHALGMQEIICLCTMQRLPTAEYVGFCNRLLSLCDKNKIDPYMLQCAITSPPSFPHNRIIIDNYRNPDVIKLLKSIQNDKKVTRKEIKVYIPDILSGKAKDDLDSSDEDDKG